MSKKRCTNSIYQKLNGRINRANYDQQNGGIQLEHSILISINYATGWFHMKRGTKCKLKGSERLFTAFDFRKIEFCVNTFSFYVITHLRRKLGLNFQLQIV
jgi:hypothetical protein